MAQRELPMYSPAELAQHMGRPELATTARVSGGQILEFEKGWAIDIFSNGNRGHYFEQVDDVTVRSACGVETWRSRMYGVGNYDLCSRCDGVMLRRMKKSR
jgi:hypothetical protein